MKKIHILSIILAFMLGVLCFGAGCKLPNNGGNEGQNQNSGDIGGGETSGGGDVPLFPDDSSWEHYEPVKNDDIISISLNKTNYTVHSGATFKDFLNRDLMEAVVFVEKKLSGVVSVGLTANMIDNSTWDTSKKGSFDLNVNYKGFKDKITVNVMEKVDKSTVFTTKDINNPVFHEKVTLLPNGQCQIDESPNPDEYFFWTREENLVTFNRYNDYTYSVDSVIFEADDKNSLLSVYHPAGEPVETFNFDYPDPEFALTIEIFEKYTQPGRYLTYFYNHSDVNPVDLCMMAEYDKELSLINLVGDMMFFYKGNDLYDLLDEKVELQLYKSAVIRKMRYTWHEITSANGKAKTLDPSAFDKHYKDIYNDVLNAKTKNEVIYSSATFVHLLVDMKYTSPTIDAQTEAMSLLKEYETTWAGFPKEIREDMNFYREFQRIELNLLIAKTNEEIEYSKDDFAYLLEMINGGNPGPNPNPDPDVNPEELEKYREKVLFDMKSRWDDLEKQGYDLTPYQEKYDILYKIALETQDIKELDSINYDFNRIVNDITGNNQDPEELAHRKEEFFQKMHYIWEDLKKNGYDLAPYESNYYKISDCVHNAQDLKELENLRYEFDELVDKITGNNPNPNPDPDVKPEELEMYKEKVLSDMKLRWEDLNNGGYDLAPYESNYYNIFDSVQNAQDLKELDNLIYKFDELVNKITGNNPDDKTFEEEKQNAINNVIDKWKSLSMDFDTKKYQKEFDMIMFDLKNSQSRDELNTILDNFYKLSDRIQSDHFNPSPEKIDISLDIVNYEVKEGTTFEEFFNNCLAGQLLHVKKENEAFDIKISRDMFNDKYWDKLMSESTVFDLQLKYANAHIDIAIHVIKETTKEDIYTFAQDTCLIPNVGDQLILHNDGSCEIDWVGVFGTYKINGNLLIVNTTFDVRKYSQYLVIDKNLKTLTYYKPSSSVINTYTCKDNNQGINFSVTVYGDKNDPKGMFYAVYEDEWSNAKLATIDCTYNLQDKIISFLDEVYQFDDATKTLTIYVSPEIIKLRDEKLNSVKTRWDALKSQGYDLSEYQNNYDFDYSSLSDSTIEDDIIRYWQKLDQMLTDIEKRGPTAGAVQKINLDVIDYDVAAGTTFDDFYNKNLKGVILHVTTNKGQEDIPLTLEMIYKDSWDIHMSEGYSFSLIITYATQTCYININIIQEKLIYHQIEGQALLLKSDYITLNDDNTISLGIDANTLWENATWKRRENTLTIIIPNKNGIQKDTRLLFTINDADKTIGNYIPDEPEAKIYVHVSETPSSTSTTSIAIYSKRPIDKPYHYKMIYSITTITINGDGMETKEIVEKAVMGFYDKNAKQLIVLGDEFTFDDMGNLTPVQKEQVA